MTYLLYLALNLAVLTFAAFSAQVGGWRLYAALWVLGIGAGMINNMIEAVVFRVAPLASVFSAIAMAAVSFAVLAGVAILISRKWRAGDRVPAGPVLTVPKLAAIVVAYEILYFAAGTVVFPYVAAFYADRGLPSGALVFALQVPRALLWVAFAYPLLRLSPRLTPLNLALAYGVIGGIAPLVVDNPLMPLWVRIPHMIETSTSNFLFGLFVGWLLTYKRAPDRAVA
jgi:hypothetical protein